MSDQSTQLPVASETHQQTTIFRVHPEFAYVGISVSVFSEQRGGAIDTIPFLVLGTI